MRIRGDFREKCNVKRPAPNQKQKQQRKQVKEVELKREKEKVKKVICWGEKKRWRMWWKVKGISKIKVKGVCKISKNNTKE